MRSKLISTIFAILMLTAVSGCPMLAQVAKPAAPAKQVAPPVPAPLPQPAKAGPAEVSGPIEKVRGDVTIEKGQTVKEVSTVQGNITVRGHVTGDATAVTGNIDVKPGGKVDGDATTVMGKVTIRPGGSVGGDATAVMGGVIQEVGGSIGGNKTTVGPPVPKWTHGWFGWLTELDETGGLLLVIAAAAALVLAQVLVAALLTALFPQRMSVVAECVTGRPGWSVLYGLVGLMAAVPIALLLLVTCVGIPFIGVEAVLLWVIWVFGGVGVKLAVGKRFGEGTNRPFRSPVWAVVVGAILLGLVRQIPIVGGMLVSVLVLFGFGAVIMTGFGADPDWFSRRFSKTTPTQPTPASPAPPTTDTTQEQ